MQVPRPALPLAQPWTVHSVLSTSSTSEFLRREGCAVYNHFMAEEVIHISEAEAATTNVATLLAHVRAGAEVVIENGARPVAVLQSAEPHPGRLLSESIALAEAHAKELGYEPTLDAEFAADLKEIINSRKPRNVSTWE
jgi:antitoxin (DNA-binding transcriptional repressor) of toxin-antitoxin stability system